MIYFVFNSRIGILQHVTTIRGYPAAFDGIALISQAASIGDNVIMGADAKNNAVKIGNNVRIGAGTVVIYDVPNGCTATGVPAHIIYPDK